MTSNILVSLIGMPGSGKSTVGAALAKQLGLELVDADGLIDVNPYTLQHERYENVFAFGDAIRGNITRS